MTPTITPLHHTIAAGIRERGATTFRPTWLTADIEVYDDPTGTKEAHVVCEGTERVGQRDDQWGYIEREYHVEGETWGADADGLLDALANLVMDAWDITLIEIPEHIAQELLATVVA